MVTEHKELTLSLFLRTPAEKVAVISLYVLSCCYFATVALSLLEIISLLKPWQPPLQA